MLIFERFYDPYTIQIYQHSKCDFGYRILSRGMVIDCGESSAIESFDRAMELAIAQLEFHRSN